MTDLTYTYRLGGGLLPPGSDDDLWVAEAHVGSAYSESNIRIRLTIAPPTGGAGVYDVTMGLDSLRGLIAFLETAYAGARKAWADLAAEEER